MLVSDKAAMKSRLLKNYLFLTFARLSSSSTTIPSRRPAARSPSISLC